MMIPPWADDAANANRFGWISTAASAIRYRFFLLAGIFPYLLGAALAYRGTGAIDLWLLLVGFAGVIFVSVGIEGMNEYFDSKIGGDRVFQSTKRVDIRWHLPVGLVGFSSALVAALYLAHLQDWRIIGFVFFGAVVALSYLIPPVHLSYRGLGETVIALGYGPGLTLGSFYLQTGQLSATCILVSLIPSLLVFSMALANEVPDYYGDRLIGKRNIIVRIGRKKGVYLYGIGTALCFCVMLAGLIARIFPPLLWLSLFLVPLALINWRLALRYYEAPVHFSRVISGTILLYVLVNAVAIASYTL